MSWKIVLLKPRLGLFLRDSSLSLVDIENFKTKKIRMKKKTLLKKQRKNCKKFVGPAESECSTKSNLETDTTEPVIPARTAPKRKPLNRKSFCIASLRRSSYRWPPRNEIRNLAKIGRNQYLCAHCPKTKIYGRKDTQVDHISPVVPVESGWISLDSFAERLLCEVSGFQILCKQHHTIKTQQEKELRKHYRKVNKENES